MRIVLSNPTSFAAFSSVGGDIEAKGPLGEHLDYVDHKNRFDQRTWEQSEAKMQDIALILKTPSRYAMRSQLQNVKR